jgi:hypothetical protein
VFVAAHAALAARPRAVTLQGATVATSGQVREYDVKAAYIFNLLPYTTWPPEAFRSPAAPLTICVAQPSPFGDLLRQTFQNEHVGAHPVVVTAVASPTDIRDCHVLFIGAKADGDGALERAASSLPILTIGEAEPFAQRGGMITFVIEYGRVRIDVSQSAAERAHIQFSSKILQVARKIT